MNLLDRGMSVLPAFRSLCEDIRTGRLPAEVTGLGHIHKAVFTAALAHTLSLKTVVLVADEAEANRLCQDLQALGLQARFLPARELSLRRVESASREFEQMRLGTLAKMAAGDYDCVVACADAASQYTLPPDLLRSRTLTLKEGVPLPVKDLSAALTVAGYERCDQIEGPGQFAVRGGIIEDRKSVV